MADEDIDWGDDAHQELALLIGRVCMAWNELQYTIYGLFEVTSELEPNAAGAAFFSLKADTAQRDLVQALFSAQFQGRPDLVKKLTKAMNEIGKMSGERNAAIHTAWSYWASEHRMGPSMAWIAHKSLKGNPAHHFSDLVRRIDDQCEVIWEVFDEALALMQALPPKPLARFRMRPTR